MKEKIQKINVLYMLAYIFAPIIICALCYTLFYFCFREGGTGAVVTTMVPTILAVIWWVAGGRFLFKRHTKAFEAKFEQAGYKRQQTFYGRGKTVVLDVDKGMMGIVFFWNPNQDYILPAAHIQKAWVDDGKTGVGIMEGSGRVSFVFTIDDDVKVRVYTFTSNQRFKMSHEYVQRGIKKAENMVAQIETAKKNSKK